MTKKEYKTQPKVYPSYQPIDQVENIAIKKRVMEIMEEVISAPSAELNDAIRACYHVNASVNISHPINELPGLDAVEMQYWRPMCHALPDVERRYDFLASGIYRDDHLIGCFGHYVGTFENDWLGIPATGGVVAVRYAEGHMLREGKIAQSYVFIDFIDLMRQVGYWPIAPSLGREMHWLSPMTHDGVILSPQDNDISRQTIERVLSMHGALGKYSGRPPTREVLDEMHMVDHWHPNFMWYGPAGIGTTRGLKGFEDYHQIPFLVAFPDRGGNHHSGSGLSHFIRIGDGSYGVTGGWGHLQATHTGNDFLGVPATGKRVAMRVMDFYRCDEVTICENWVPIDIPHLLMQMGVDVFGRMRLQFRQNEKLSIRNWLLRSS